MMGVSMWGEHDGETVINVVSVGPRSSAASVEVAREEVA